MQPIAMVPVARTSGWSRASWILFALAAATAVATAGGLLAFDAVSEDGYGPVYKLFLILGGGFARLASLALAGVGALCGLIGLLNPAMRTYSTWAAVGLNAALIVVSFILMMALSG